MKQVFGSNKVYMADSGMAGVGRGVFAKVRIGAGEVIELCPVIELNEDDSDKVSESVLATYLFYAGKALVRSMVVLGFGSLYNHSDMPNARYVIREKERVVEFLAVKNIQKDEEILINYRGESDNQSPLWFEV